MVFFSLERSRPYDGKSLNIYFRSISRTQKPFSQLLLFEQVGVYFCSRSTNPHSRNSKRRDKVIFSHLLSLLKRSWNIVTLEILQTPVTIVSKDLEILSGKTWFHFFAPRQVASHIHMAFITQGRLCDSVRKSIITACFCKMTLYQLIFLHRAT